MPNINDINGVTVANLAKLDAVLKANISTVNGLTLAAAFTGLLDTYTGAAAAYSTRKLKSGVTVAMRIRRSGDDIEADVEFDSNNEISLTSPISNASSGTYTDLADFVDHSTTPRDAFVKEWKDQSGSGNHATQSTSGEQPQLYDATTGLIRNDNGNVAIQFIRTSSTSLDTPDFDMYTDGWFCVTVAEKNGDVGDQKYIDAFGGIGDRTGQIFAHPGSGLTTLQATSTGGSGASVTGSITTNVSYIWTSENTSSNLNLYVNGSSAGTASITSQGDAAKGFNIGKRQGVAEGYSDTFSSEIIYWPSDESSNRTAIETDINTEFLIYQPTDAPTSGLLATYTGAAAAYSVRQLSDKAVIAMRIRRDSDDEERNIGWDANGDLDTTAISDFCGTANGYVVEWADQSTNGNHATQSIAGSQPQIYNGTAVITENGKPVLQSASGAFLEGTADNSMKCFGVGRLDTDGIFLHWAGGLTPAGWLMVAQSGSTSTAIYDNTVITINAWRRNGASYAYSSKTRGDIYTDFTSQHLVHIDASITKDDVGMGYKNNPSSFPMLSQQEVILYPSSSTHAASDIESNINTYFSIYT